MKILVTLLFSLICFSSNIANANFDEILPADQRQAIATATFQAFNNYEVISFDERKEKIRKNGNYMKIQDSDDEALTLAAQFEDVQDMIDAIRGLRQIAPILVDWNCFAEADDCLPTHTTVLNACLADTRNPETIKGIRELIKKAAEHAYASVSK